MTTTNAESPTTRAGEFGEDDLVRIGKELGLSEAQIRTAIQQEWTAPPEQEPRPWRTQSVRTVTLALDGRDELVTNEIIEVLRSEFGRVGKVTRNGPVTEWLGAEGGFDSVHVSITPDGGQTRLRFRSDLAGAGFLSGFIGTLAVGLATAISLKVAGPAGAVGAAGIGAGASGLWYALMCRGLRRREEAIQRAIGRISAMSGGLAIQHVTETVTAEDETGRVRAD